MNRDFPDLIRCAVASGDLEAAQLLWSDYARLLGEQLDHGVLAESGLREAGLLVEWTRQALLAQKAHMRDSLNDFAASVHVEQAYGALRPPMQAPCLSFLA